MPQGQIVALASSPAMDSSIDSARSRQGFPAHNATNTIISQILSLRATLIHWWVHGLKRCSQWEFRLVLVWRGGIQAI